VIWVFTAESFSFSPTKIIPYGFSLVDAISNILHGIFDFEISSIISMSISVYSEIGEGVSVVC